MAWLWNSWQDYLDGVQPVVVDTRGAFGLARDATYFEAESEFHDSLQKLQHALSSLGQLGFTGRDNEPAPEDTSILDDAHRYVIELVYAGEKLLLYHRRLAQSDDAYGFLSQHDILDHWDRYAGTHRILQEIDQLVTDTNEMMVGFYRMKTEDEKFLIYGLDLPTDLEADFRMARSLFSIGVEEVGLFMTGRGLESVLRNIAKMRKITIVKKNQIEPAHEASLSDLIEAMAKLRWKRSGELLLTQQTKALLHFLRTQRNSYAHPVLGQKKSTLAPRELARLVTETADKLWKDVTGTRARFVQTAIQKSGSVGLSVKFFSARVPCGPSPRDWRRLRMLFGRSPSASVRVRRQS